MKTTVLNANRDTANEISKDLLSRKGNKGQPLFQKRATNKGFEITARLRGNGEEVVVFRYTNDNGRRQFDYDERLLSF